MRAKLNHFRLLAIAFLMLLLPKQLAAYTLNTRVRVNKFLLKVGNLVRFL